MNTITTPIFFFDIARHTAAIRRVIAWIAIPLVAVALVVNGCGPAMTRPEVDRQKLLKLRNASDAEFVASGERIVVRLLQHQDRIRPARRGRTAAAGDRYPD